MKVLNKQKGSSSTQGLNRSGPGLAMLIKVTLEELQNQGFVVFGELKIKKGQKSFRIKAGDGGQVSTVIKFLENAAVTTNYSRRERY
jgi:hypothetical protein